MVEMDRAAEPEKNRDFDRCHDCGAIRAMHDHCPRFFESSAVPQPAEVGLDLHLLRHEVIEAAKKIALASLARTEGLPDNWGPMMSALHYRTQQLLAGEEEHAKIVAANPAVESPPAQSATCGSCGFAHREHILCAGQCHVCPSNEGGLFQLVEMDAFAAIAKAERSKGKAAVCRELRKAANALLNGDVAIARAVDDGLHEEIQGEELEGIAETLADAAFLIDGMTFEDGLRCLCKWDERNPFNPECPVHAEPKP